MPLNLVTYDGIQRATADLAGNTGAVITFHEAMPSIAGDDASAVAHWQILRICDVADSIKRTATIRSRRLRI